jgi:biotin transporter BioY
MVVSALLSALLVASAWIAIPVGNVPITLQVLLVIFLWIDLLKSALAVWLAGPLRQVLLQG